MGTDKQMDDIVAAGSEEDSGATITTETVLDSNTVYDWKVEHTDLVKKLEDRFNKEVHIPIAKQPTDAALREEVIPGVDHSVDFPSFYDVEELDVSYNWTITAVNESAYNPTIEELDVKLPATKKAQDVLLEDLVPCSRLSPLTATNRFGIGEQLSVSQDVNNNHVLNDNNKSTSKENEKQEHPKMMEVPVANQQMDMPMESELVSKTTTKIVNLNHTKEFQECMDIYEIANGVHSFNTIALAIAFYECTCNIHLVVTKSLAHNYQQYSCKQHLGCNFHISFGQHHGTGLLDMKKCNFLHYGYTTETIAKGRRKLKRRRKDSFSNHTF